MRSQVCVWKQADQHVYLKPLSATDQTFASDLLHPPSLLFLSISIFLPPYLFFWRGSMPLNTHSYQRQSRKAGGTGAFEKCLYIHVCVDVWSLLQRGPSISVVSFLYVNNTMITWVCVCGVGEWVSGWEDMFAGILLLICDSHLKVITLLFISFKIAINLWCINIYICIMSLCQCGSHAVFLPH